MDIYKKYLYYRNIVATKKNSHIATENPIIQNLFQLILHGFLIINITISYL